MNRWCHATHRSLFAWLLLCSIVLSPRAQDGTPTTKIGTWNLEWLGAPGDVRNHLPPRDDTDLQKIGEKIRSLGVAVLAVQEIAGEAPLRKVAAGAGPQWRVLLGSTGGIEGKPQNIGFLYDSDAVVLLQAEELLGFPRELEGVPIFNRVPLTACFRIKATGFDFRVVTVHLKAGQKNQDAQKRRLEATRLHDWIAGLENDGEEDHDIVVLGDFNSTYGAEPEVALETGGALQYMHPMSPTPTIMHFPEPIDQVAVAPGFPELRSDSFVVHDDLDGLDKDAWRKTYSDHFPVTVAIAASHDTDPDAKFRLMDPANALPRNLPTATLPVAQRQGTSVDILPHRGMTVTVHMQGTPDVTGELLADPPHGPDGWVVLLVDGAHMAIPCCQVVQLIWR